MSVVSQGQEVCYSQDYRLKKTIQVCKSEKMQPTHLRTSKLQYIKYLSLSLALYITITVTWKRELWISKIYGLCTLQGITETYRYRRQGHVPKIHNKYTLSKAAFSEHHAC